MSEKQRKIPSGVKQTKKTIKQALILGGLALVTLLMALWGINPNRIGESSGGVAATVNDTTISLHEYQSRVEAIEQNAKIRLDQFPEAQRKALNHEIHRRALDELIMGEVMYQAARNRGVMAPDAEVREYILQIPFLQENGRFLKDRYKMFLQNMNLSTDDYERQVRKQIVGQKLQELFVGSAMPTREELKRNRELSNHKVNIRYVEIKKDDLQKPAFVSDEEVNTYLKSNKAEVEKYYNENKTEFIKLDKVHAAHILIATGDKRSDAEAKKLADELKKQATPATFAKLATKNSDDPGSKAKGGDLGEFERGRMVPEFDKAAFALKAGEISEPIKSNYGYHIIYVEKKIPGGTVTLEQAQNEIARKLYLRSKEAEIVAKTKTLIEKAPKKEVDAFIAKAGLKWTESGEFDLSSPVVPKLGDSKEVIAAILKHGQTPGLIPNLITMPGGYVIVDVTSWKQAPDTSNPAEVEGIEQMVANKKSSDLIDAWSREVEAKANVSRNPAILAQ
jgi:peptidyl-prolyl cis-trans isomerase D